MCDASIGLMRQKRVLATLALCSAFLIGAACGDDLQEDETGVCQTTCLITEVAVECDFGLGITKVQCAPDKYIAAYNCQEGNGVPGQVVPHCDADGGGGDDEAGTTTTTTTGWGGAWEPLAYVEIEPMSGARVIDREFFEIVTADLSQLERDETVLRSSEDGAFFVAYAGELCEALGLERYDQFEEVNGYAVSSFAAFSKAYEVLSGESAFELTVLRDGERVVLSYRVE